MSISYVCNTEKKLTITVWSHKVTFEQWKNNITKFIHDPDFLQTTKQVVDIHIGSLDISIGENEIKHMVRYIADHPELIKNRKVAIVAGQEFKRSSLFSNFARIESLNTIVFNDLNTACKWLGIDRIETENTIDQLRSSMSANR